MAFVTAFFLQVEIKGFKWRMLIVSVKFPRSISTEPLVWTLVMVYGPLVGLFIFGWQWHSSESRIMSTSLPGRYCLVILDLSSFELDAARVFWCSLWMLSKLICTAQRKIMSWLNAKWQGECLMVGLTVVQTAQATASKVCCMLVNQSEPEKVMVHSMSPMVRCTCSMTPLLQGFLTVVARGLIQ